jgi:D-alanine-D-alanine ligase
VRVAVLAGGRSSEHDVSLDSGATVRAALEAGGHEVIAVRLTRSGVWKGPDGAELSLVPGGGLLGAEVVFPVLHGPFGEDGTIQGLLELLDLPYVGAGVLASSLCMDKVVFKEVLAAAGVPQVAYLAVREARWQESPDAVREALAGLGLPLFVKPARLGSSVGISKVAAAEELDGALETAFQHDGLAIAEAFSPGIEVECAVTGLGEPEASLPAEVVLQGDADWYDYEAKYAPGGVELEIPARVGEDVIAEVQALARETFLRVGCAGLARVDFFVEDGRVLVNELNTLPGMTATSGFPKMWEASGRAFPEVCDRLLALALERYRAERAGHAF